MRSAIPTRRITYIVHVHSPFGYSLIHVSYTPIISYVFPFVYRAKPTQFIRSLCTLRRFQSLSSDCPTMLEKRLTIVFE